MVPVLITTLGAVIVALIALIGPRIEARDARARLAKDVEVMGKLAADSDARRVLERHAYHTTLAIEAADRMRVQFRPAFQWGLMGVATMSASLAILLAMGGRNHGPILEMLRFGALPMSYFLIGISVIVMILCSWSFWRADRHMRKYLAARHATEESDNGPPTKPGTEDEPL